MALILWSNDASSSLAAPVTNIATTAILATGSGVLFPSPTGGNYFVATFVDAATGLLNEIVHVTNVTGDVVTMIRAQEGTTALNWSANDLFSNLVTAGSLSALQQTAGAQAQAPNYCGAPTGTANAIVAAFTPAVTAHTPGMPLRVLISANNTGPTTFDPGPGVIAVVGPTGAALVSEELVAENVIEFIYNGTDYVVQQTVATTPPALFATQTDETGSRALNTSYTNSGSKPMFVSVVAGTVSANGNLNMVVNGVSTFKFGQEGAGAEAAVCGMVPPGDTYEVTTDSAPFTLQSWVETQ